MATARGQICKSQNLVMLSTYLHLEAAPQVARQNLSASLPVAFRDSIIDKIQGLTLIATVKLAFNGNKGLCNQFELQLAALN